MNYQSKRGREALKKLPLGIQNFREVIEDNHVYVDKTMYIHQLINNGKCYFLSRPRRFGKSLLLDTIAEVFRGNKELFKGLWIYESDYGFRSHPVIKLDMSNISSKSPDIFERSLLEELQYNLQREDISASGGAPPDLFKQLIRGLHNKHNQKVVVLIDEYDKPILDHITKYATAEANRTILRDFYGILKSLDSCIKFIFFTGVSKFTKTSTFSSLNNLSDITMQEDYANICGIPVDDLDLHFGDRIRSLADHKNLKHYPSLRDAILKWYDGYSWDGETKLLNPFGLLSFFQMKQLKSFWYASGSPKFLIDLIMSRPESVTDFDNLTISETALDAIDIRNLEIGSLLFQTGYLTVLKAIPPEPDFGIPPAYLLEIPNLEVRDAFFKQLTAGLVEKEYIFAENAYWQIHKALRAGDLQSVLNMLKSLFSSIPNQLHINMEAYYHSIFFAAMNVLGFKIEAEVSVSRGRIDAALELEDKAYVFEFKYENCPPDADEDTRKKIFDKTLELGMKQIKDRGYADKYIGSGKTVYLAAFAFLGRDNVEMLSSVLPPGEQEKA